MAEESNIIYLARVERHYRRLLRTAREARLREQLAFHKFRESDPFSAFSEQKTTAET